jgi:transaldolase
MANPLVALQQLGQSPWLDNIQRALLTSGKLKAMVEAGDITGLTSNPTIFEQAIAKSQDYDAALTKLAKAGKSAEEIFDALASSDIRDAADVFRPVYERTKGEDGYVSIEVAPRFAHDTAGTVAEAKRLWKLVDRPNLMVKIPATLPGIPAIEQCIAEGLNINVTLIFSLDRYQAVANAYVQGLTRLKAAGGPVGRVASVASFFVSRVDTAIDKQLEERLAASPSRKAALEPLLGQAAIANAKLAYAEFLKIFGGSQFAALAAAGARRQRPLWASTSTKNPRYPDTYYAEALVGEGTVDTLPPATLDAYRDHGKPKARLGEGLEAARATLAALAREGIELTRVTHQLEQEGVASFVKSFDTLLGVVERRRVEARP